MNSKSNKFLQESIKKTSFNLPEIFILLRFLWFYDEFNGRGAVRSINE